jgi:hypothetical protein
MSVRKGNRKDANGGFQSLSTFYTKVIRCITCAGWHQRATSGGWGGGGSLGRASSQKKGCPRNMHEIGLLCRGITKLT